MYTQKNTGSNYAEQKFRELKKKKPANKQWTTITLLLVTIKQKIRMVIKELKILLTN